MSVLSDLAEQIYDHELGFGEVGDARQVEVDMIEAWLDAHLGELNTLINTSFRNTDLSLFKEEEGAILREMYLINYYRKHGRNVLRLIDGSTNELDFQTIREGDSVITRTNKSEIAKNYRLLMSNSQERLDKMVHAYNMYRSKPSQVTGDDAPA
ncbi:MAG: hypothetical protein CL885_03300 [Dehalococcoidia bacterium]|nr:hypothetical protein [Dehalococcoidia bacterium]|tara:strand:- start:415 stop:876 length:462 start_codon:yes stop_codon:yes gene_type:complete